MIDVIFPTYNQCEFLALALSRILAQSLRDFNLIIVNDGSTDATRGYLETLADPRVRVVEHHTNRKLPAALNTGHAAGSAPYCTWISTDNISYPDHLSTLHRHMSLCGCDIVQGPSVWVKNERRRVFDPRRWKRGWWGIGSLGPAFLYRREVWEQHPYDESMYGWEDLRFFVEVVLHPFVLHYVDSEPLVEYHSQPNSITGRGIPDRYTNLCRIEREVIYPKLGRVPRRRSPKHL